MQYMGGKSRIARYIAEIINNSLTGGLALLAFSAAVVLLKAKLPAMTALY